MSEYLKNIKKQNSFQKSKKRVGRGTGSGKGSHCVGKGNKGQKSRTGGKTRIWFEGGQMPLIRRLPYKQGFINVNTKIVFGINLGDIEKFDLKKDILTPDYFYDAKTYGVVKGTKVKILSKGTLTKKITFKGFDYSSKAKEKIEKSGSVIE